MERFFLVYKTMNKAKGEYYIGVHITDDMNDDYLGSGKRLRRSIEKYGREAFERDILAVFDNPNDMFLKEAELVNEETLKDPLCLNLKVGGYGGWGLKDKSILYNSESQSRRSKMNDPQWRKENSDRIKAWSQKGLENARKKLSKMREEGYRSKGSLGYHHTEEHKKRMSDIMKDAQSGKRNSQYGKCWIHSQLEKKSIRVMKDEIQEWLDKGWIVGRKMRFD